MPCGDDVSQVQETARVKPVGPHGFAGVRRGIGNGQKWVIFAVQHGVASASSWEEAGQKLRKLQPLFLLTQELTVCY